MMFSIIVPVYNGEKSISKCVRSVLDQSYDDWELILVNDGSTDGSGNQIDELAAADSRICVVHQENKGQLLARRTGIELAQGEFLLFLDCDDYWHPDCLSVLHRAITENAPDVVMFPGKRVGSTRQAQELICHISEEPKWIDKTYFYSVLISGPDFNSLCLKAWRRSLFEGDSTDYSPFSGGYWGEDRIQALYPITKAEKIFFIPQPLYFYVDNPLSVTHTVNMERIRNILSNQGFAVLYTYMKLWNMDVPHYREACVVQYLRHFLSVYYKVRKLCLTRQERRQFRRYNWKAEVSPKAFRYVLSKKLSCRDKIRLILAICFKI